MTKSRIQVPSEEELAKLPCWARVAFAARCARRVQSLFQAAWPDAPRELVLATDAAIAIAERFSSSSDLDDVFEKAGIAASAADDDEYYGTDHIGVIDVADEPFSPSSLAMSPAYRAARTMEHDARAAAEAAAIAIDEANAKTAKVVAGAARTAAEAAADTVAFYYRMVDRNAVNVAAFFEVTGANAHRAILQDFHQLQAACSKLDRIDHTRFSPEFFGPFFPADAIIEHRVMLAINDFCIKLCELIASDSKALTHIDWRQLEEVVATSLKGIGFYVTLTPPSKDGGKDVIAQCMLRGQKTTYYIEIKHWRSGKSVGTREVSHFVEVNARDGTDGGLLISSSGFAPSVYTQLTEITRHRVRLGSDTKVVSLCRHFVRSRGQINLKPKDILPQVLFQGTFPNFVNSRDVTE